jgi:hypothetical protein
MSLAVFGMVLLGALVALCWSCGRSIATAVVAMMLGLTIAGSSGALAVSAHSVVDSVRTGVTALGASLFGGGR